MSRWIAAAVVYASVSTTLIAAEPPASPTFASADALKAQIDAGMPGILKRDPAMFRLFLENLLPADKIESEMAAWQKAMKRIDGQPELSWKYVGSKSLGSICRQHFYICRYERLYTVWRFMTVEKEGRWSLVNYRINGNAEDLQEPASVSNQQCAQLGDKIIGMIAQGDRSLGELLEKQFVAHDKELVEVIDSSARKLQAYSLLGGRLLKWERVGSRQIEDVCVQNDYVIQWKDGSVMISLDFYRAADQWRVIGVDYSAVNDTSIAKAPWDRSLHQASTPRPGLK